MGFISELVTMLTDYVLSALALFYGVILFSHSEKNKTRYYWSLAFISLAISALIGGTYHGFSEILGESTKFILWKATLGFTSLMSMFLLIASAKSTVSSYIQKIIIWCGAVKFTVFLTILASSDQFMLVIFDYAFNMLVVICLYIFGSYKYDIKSSSKFIIAGVLISFVAAGIQLSKFNIHHNFNNNDFYHVIQIIALYFFYRGAKKLNDVKN